MTSSYRPGPPAPLGRPIDAPPPGGAALGEAGPARTRAMDARRELREVTLEAELDAMRQAAARELTELEERHEATLVGLWASAEAEAQRLLDTARSDAVAIRSTAASISAQLRRPAEPGPTRPC